MERLGKLFAKQEDPYAGVNRSLALRLGSVLWLIGIVLVLALWPLSPPDEQIGDAGWIIGCVLAAAGVAYAVTLRSGRISWDYEMLLVSSYFGLASIALMQWLAGGVGAPYERLMLLPLLYVAVLHPPRRILAFLVAVGLALFAPLIYEGWDADHAAGAFATFILWAALALAGYLMMSAVRAQRMSMRRGEEEAREQARVDELTGIGNRRAFEEAIDDEIARATRMKTPLSVALGDIVNFKQVNDEWGHLEGDGALRRVAETIAGELRVPDRVFRWGGDEFALLLPGTNPNGALELADRIQNKVAVVCRRPDSEAIRVRFGVAELLDGMSGTDLVESADLSLLAVKSRS